MAKKPPDNLDDRLRRWANEHTPAKSNMELLRVRIVEQIRGEGFDSTPARPETLSPSGKAVWFSVGLAAAILLCVGGLWLANRLLPQVAAPLQPSESIPPEFAQFERSQLAGKSALLAEVERLFGDRLAWIAETKDHVSFGLTTDSLDPTTGQNGTSGSDAIGHAHAQGKPLAVRVVVARRQAGTTKAESVWSVDFLARSEQVVHLTSADAQGAELLVWVYSLPDGKIAVDTNLALSGPTAVAMTSSGLQNSGVPAGVYSTRHGDTEYEVFQTVAFLEDEVH